MQRLTRDERPSPEAPREWLVTNGLGGYASATIAGAIARRYHGFLIAALPAPLGRMIVLNDLEVAIERIDGSVANMRRAVASSISRSNWDCRAGATKSTA